MSRRKVHEDKWDPRETNVKALYATLWATIALIVVVMVFLSSVSCWAPKQAPVEEPIPEWIIKDTIKLKKL